MTERIDCDLLTGFLGSGKTTLLNAWLRSPRAAGTAVIVNEVGNIGIDQLALARVTDNITLLESGCLCCTLSGSLRETILDVLAAAEQRRSPLTRIVIETTGLAEPLPILHSLLGDKLLTGKIRLNQVVVTLDGQQGLHQLDSYPECVRQLASAERVVISKADVAVPAQLEQLRARIREINPAAVVEQSVSGDAAVSVFSASAGKGQRDALISLIESHDHDHDHGDGTHEHAHHHPHHEQPHSGAHTPDDGQHGAQSGAPVYHSRVSTFGFYVDHSIAWAGLAAWWHLVSTHYGDQLLRSKGLLRMQDPARPAILMQTVGKVFHPPEALSEWPDADRRSRLVCIGIDLDRSWLFQSLAALRINEPGAMPGTLEELSYFVPQHSE